MRNPHRHVLLWLIMPLISVAVGCAQLYQDDAVDAESVIASSTQPVQPYDRQAINRIRDEGLNRSQVTQTLSFLSDVIGPRLTGSPNLKRANQWTREKLASWGLENAHLEAWGPFGRGWAIKRFSAEVIEPQEISLTAYPKAWSPGFDQPLEAEVVRLNPQTDAELQEYAGKIEGKIILIGGERPVHAHFTPDGTRLTDEDLARLARGRGGRGPTTGRGPSTGRAELVQPAGNRGNGRGPASAGSAPTPIQILTFAFQQKASLVITASTIGDGGTIVVQQASAVGSAVRNFTGPQVWTTNAPPTIPQLTLAVEQFNRLTRMIDAGEKVKIAVNLQVEYFNDDPMAYNTVAEIPGTDLKNQIVMLGGHMDSWHSGTGATDNGAGVAVAMEAVRIIKALNLRPRRTIRIALWTGEEEGLYGSAAYVGQHFGTAPPGRGGAFGGGGRGRGRGASTGPTTSRITKGPDYENLSVYFNLDNGTGKIRGIYAQGNPGVVPIFREWLKPFADLGATTVTLNNTGSTDHISFDNVGLPGFQFIQDDIEYFTRTHHTNADVFDRIQPDDVKQAATIMAAFIYNAAMMDEKMPRKPGY